MLRLLADEHKAAWLRKSSIATIDDCTHTHTHTHPMIPTENDPSPSIYRFRAALDPVLSRTHRAVAAWLDKAALASALDSDDMRLPDPDLGGCGDGRSGSSATTGSPASRRSVRCSG